MGRLDGRVALVTGAGKGWAKPSVGNWLKMARILWL